MLSPLGPPLGRGQAAMIIYRTGSCAFSAGFKICKVFQLGLIDRYLVQSSCVDQAIVGQPDHVAVVPAHTVFVPAHTVFVFLHTVFVFGFAHICGCI